MGTKPFCWCAAPGSITLATYSLCIRPVPSAGKQRALRRGKSRSLMGRRFPAQVVRHLGNPSAGPVGQRLQDGRRLLSLAFTWLGAQTRRAGRAKGGGKEQTPLMSVPGTSCLCLPGGVPPVLSLLPTFGEGGNHCWGLKGCEAPPWTLAPPPSGRNPAQSPLTEDRKGPRGVKGLMRPPRRGSQSQGCPGLPAPRLSCRMAAGLPPPPHQSGGLGIPTGLTLPRRVFEKELMSVSWVAN